MKNKEAKSRIKINELLANSGWSFFDNDNTKANIQLEPNVKLSKEAVNSSGDNFENTPSGYVDYLLLDKQLHPMIVLEAKAEDKDPLVGKEQARRYAKSLNCKYVILSNGNLHYFWDITSGNPYLITSFPSPESVEVLKTYKPSPEKLVSEVVDDEYIALTQFPDLKSQPGWNDVVQRKLLLDRNKLRLLRKYQVDAIKALQNAVRNKKSRFLFEMATGTGKTLTSAAVIKLFLRTGNAHRVLFLVDRIELEDQAQKSFKFLLKNDYTSVIYKENKDDWRKAQIVVTTVQSLLFNSKFKLFSPTDFDLVISDEAHRSVNGSSRSVFEYFIGYKLGLTATPKDYLKGAESLGANKQREFERRMLLDTYKTFDCADGEPTFRYSLLDGVKDGVLINPLVVDARTDVTTKLLSDEGYSVSVDSNNDEGIIIKDSFTHKQYEKNFFSDSTNEIFCKTFIENALKDPISGETGKTIIFTVNQSHAAKVTKILNQLAEVYFPGQYQSDFAVQITSSIPYAQTYTVNFSNNNLLGHSKLVNGYKTSKARVAVTVGMMTTGYDCPDLLNIVLMRPIFSPSEFIQIKGRGTRKHNFYEQLSENNFQKEFLSTQKNVYKLFDFFANCEYFEDKFNYDEIIKLPNEVNKLRPIDPIDKSSIKEYTNESKDSLQSQSEKQIGLEGMKIDRMLFDRFQKAIQGESIVVDAINAGDWDFAIDYVQNNILNKPSEYFNLQNLRESVKADRRISLREFLERSLNLIPSFKSKNEIIEDEFEKMVLALQPTEHECLSQMKYYFKAYISDSSLRSIIDSKNYAELNVNPSFSITDFKSIPIEWREKIPTYIKDYISLNQFL